MTTTKLLAMVVLWNAATAAFPQNHHSTSGHQPVEPVASTTAVAPPSPYAGQQVREIKALAATQIQDLLAGKGMEFAKAAELNGYPGPMHTLELGDALQLSLAQREATAQLMAAHREQARKLGAQLVEAERDLDTAFAARQVNREILGRLTQRIGALQAELRNAHLETHLRQTSILSTQQVARYSLLRGYVDIAPSPAKH